MGTITLYAYKDDDNTEAIALYTEDEAEQAFRDMLDEAYEEVEVAGVRMTPSEVVATDGPVYREGFLNYLDAEFFCFEDVSSRVRALMGEASLEDGVLIIWDDEGEDIERIESV